MRIIVDFDDPVNDLDVLGLPADTDPGDLLGPRGRIVWRMFSAAARTLFLVGQSAQVAQQALQREFDFIEARIAEFRGPAKKKHR